MDAQLKILIVSEADNTGFKSAAEATKDLTGETGKAGESLEDFRFRGFGVRQIASELNRILPGTGMAFHGIAAGAGIATVAVLAIQAAMTWYNFYAEEAKNKSAALAGQLDFLRNTYRAAREEIDSFAEASAKAWEPKDPAGAALHQAQAVLEAQIKGKRELLKLDEEAELKNAPESQREATRKKYQAREAALEESAESQKLGLLADTILGLQEKLDPLQTLHDDLEKQKIDATRWDRTDEVAALNTRLAELDKQIHPLQEQITKYGEQARTGEQVFTANESTRIAAANRTISRATEGQEEDYTKFRPPTAEHAEANRALSALFAQYTNGLAVMQSIIKVHTDGLTTLAQENQALQNASATLQAQLAASRNHAGG